PQPLIYSSIKLEQLTAQVLRQQPTLFLSHFPLAMLEQQNQEITVSTETTEPQAKTEPHAKVEPKPTKPTTHSTDSTDSTKIPIAQQSYQLHTYLFESLSDASRTYYQALSTIQNVLRETQSLQHLLDESIRKRRALLLHLEQDWQKF